jgi:ParB family chromosome partitioning protein
MKSSRILAVPCDRITPPDHQLRASINPDALEALAHSMAAVGLLQPIRLAPDGDRYRIVAGHRRFLAALRLGWKTIPAIIDSQADETALAQSLHENLFREALTPMDEARLCAALVRDQGRSISDAARVLRHSEPWVKSRLAMVDYPPPLQDAIHRGAVPVTAAPYLARITDPDYLARALEAAESHGMTARQAMEWERQYAVWQAARAAGQDAPMPTAELVAVEAARVPCDVCERVTYVNTTKLLRVCFDCVQALQAARQSLVD